MSMTVNAQALINMSKVRLCWCADKDARKVMFEIVKQIKELEPELGSKLVPSCVYRGFCSEGNENCGYSREFLKDWRKEYLNGRKQILQRLLIKRGCKNLLFFIAYTKENIHCIGENIFGTGTGQWDNMTYKKGQDRDSQ